jgi:ribosome maturation factor RimP
LFVNKQLVEKIREVVEEFLKNSGYELVDSLYKYEAKKLVLRILTDRPQGGITLDECADLNNRIGDLIEKQNLIKESYVLEVSSPGLDRPLKESQDFKRCIDKKIVVFTSQYVDGKMQYSGIIKGVNDKFLNLEVEDKELQIPLDKITKAKQLID